MNDARPPTGASAPLAEVLIIVAIFAGWFIYASIHMVLGGSAVTQFSDSQALATITFEGLAFGLAAIVLGLRGWRLREFRFRVTWRGCAVGVLLFGVAFLVHWAVWELLGPRLGGSERLLQFSESAALSLPVALLFSAVNGAFEEFFLTRYLVSALAPSGMAIAIGASGLVRVAYHLYQGPVGAISVLGIGVVFTLFYWRHREIWPVMFAHMVADAVALT